MHLHFIPLAPGEAPGDPELGGWRPLPKNFFRKSNRLPFPAPIISLKQAIQLIRFKVRYLCLRRAIETVVTDLQRRENSTMKGGNTNVDD